ncbi:PDZ domain-containing protein [Aporhodopirellula aestuarii]|uniref:PDZ domain-containing protein n=1 Tax=Aporhodopirellula aestuarii TaxID=2950107 RepID=A0ABT0U0Q7_9BACT|nr:PDZ domain-containing protein [Aporhodopirellula aestuarii]MCM2370430.1 PDZ domain-containing protein [Aporhodopirellula aestuarii]
MIPSAANRRRIGVPFHPRHLAPMVAVILCIAAGPASQTGAHADEPTAATTPGQTSEALGHESDAANEYSETSSSTARALPAPGHPTSEATAEDIERWVTQLSSNSYLRRKRATADLTRVGQPAVERLVTELDTGDLETTERVISILQEIAAHAPIMPSSNQTADAGEDNVSTAAWDELVRISSLGGSQGTRAKIATKEVRDVRRALAIDVLGEAGVLIGTAEFILGSRSELKRIVEFDGEFDGDPALLQLLQWVDGIEYARLKGDAIRKDILEGVVQMPDLKTLALLHGEIDADELATLGDIAELRRLELRYVKMNGQLIDQLGTLPIRVSLTLNGTDAPADRVEALRKTVPGLEIIFKQGGFLGVQCYDNFDKCLINEVLRGQAAEKAGLQPGDVVLEVDGKTIKQFKDLQQAIDAHMPGEVLHIRYQRGETERNTTARLGKLEEQ